MLAKIVFASGDPNAVVYDAIHYRVSMDTATKAGVPVSFGLLRAKYRSVLSIPSLKQLK